MAAALALAAEILEGAPLSVQAAREMVMVSTEMGRSAALRAARHVSERAYHSDDAQEGPKAFAEKRRPQWKGK
jgi:enoyl-CoA hydratase/carnithine racemase